MKAMIFAAGRGERMRPLTDTCPKPLLKVKGRALIEWHIIHLVQAGITDIVINHAHLGQMIEDTLLDGKQFGAHIQYSPEKTALETAGGIANALHLLGDEPFVAVSGDIYCPTFDFNQVRDVLNDNDLFGDPYPEDEKDIAWLYLVPNPSFHPQGDFGLSNFTLSEEGETKYTFANIGVYRPSMFHHIKPGTKAALGPLLHEYAAKSRIGGELYYGPWYNVGTPDQLNALNTEGK